MSDVLSCRQLTANLKMIAGAIGCLNRNDVAQIISLGGVQCSKSRADSIIRSAGAEKNASGNSHLRGARINRSADVTPEEFNAFCAGLKAFLVSFETNNLSENNDKKAPDLSVLRTTAVSGIYKSLYMAVLIL